MDQPTFRTERLIVRPRGLGDTAACMAMDGDPEVVRFIPGPWADRLAHRAFIEARTRGPYPPGLGYWAVTTQDRPGDFLGWVSLIPWETHGPRSRSAGASAVRSGAVVTPARPPRPSSDTGLRP